MVLAYVSSSSAGGVPVRAESLAMLLRARPWGFGSHAHDGSHQLIWLSKGAGRVTLDGVTRGLAPNTAVFVPAGTVHEFSLTPISAGWVVTFPVTLPIGVPLSERAQILPLTDRAAQAALTALCDEIHREDQGEEVGRAAALMYRAGLLAVWLARQRDRADDTAKITAQRRLVHSFLRRLEAHHRTGETVADYAAAAAVTATHLTRVTRNAIGKPATTLIQDRTLLAACADLAFSDARISEISSGLGFSAPAYFTRLFTQRHGVSPSAFRRAARLSPGGQPREMAIAAL